MADFLKPLLRKVVMTETNEGRPRGQSGIDSSLGRRDSIRQSSKLRGYGNDAMAAAGTVFSYHMRAARRAGALGHSGRRGR